VLSATSRASWVTASPAIERGFVATTGGRECQLGQVLAAHREDLQRAGDHLRTLLTGGLTTVRREPS
jgi:hypothetical protein